MTPFELANLFKDSRMQFHSSYWLIHFPDLHGNWLKSGFSKEFCENSGDIPTSKKTGMHSPSSRESWKFKIILCWAGKKYEFNITWKGGLKKYRIAVGPSYNLHGTCAWHETGPLPGTCGKWGQLGGRGWGRARPPKKGGRSAVSAQQGQRQHGQGRGGTGKSGVMKKDQRQQSEPLFPKTRIMYIVNVNYVYCWAELISCFVSGE
jgi:hypothetical protein